MLVDSNIKWKVLVVSACYSGGFVEPLKDANTVVITAADDKSSSFGCALGRDPESSVVTPELKLNAYENVYVVDGSVFPTSLGVNPQLTIFALAHWAAEHVGAAIL